MSNTVQKKSENVLYLSDVVSSKDNNLGVIIEMPDSDSDEDSDDEGSLPKEAAIVSWYPSGEEEILLQEDLALKSRVLDPGMGVERAGDFRSGVLLDITANCSVKLVGTNVKVSNVPGSILTPWNLHYHEPNVVYGSWLGYILQLQQTLVVGLKNGARVLMKFDTARHMEDSKFSEISPYYSGTWYVGQKLEGKARWFKRATLLSGTMPVFKTLRQKVKGVVLEAILTGIEVEWIMHGFMNTKKKPEPPPSLITGEHMLSKIRVFERYQQRFLTIGLPALLKIPTKYNLQALLQELGENGGRLPDLDKEEVEETPIHQCKQQSTPLTVDSGCTEEKRASITSCGPQESSSNLMYETRIDEKTSAEVAEVEKQLNMKSETEGQEAGLDSVSTETEDTPDDSSKHAHILDRVFRVSGDTGDTDSEDDSEVEEDEEEDPDANNSSSEQSDSGLDDSLETNKDKDENKEESNQEISTPDINNTTQVSGKPSKILMKRARPRNTRNSRWCSNVSPKGPIEVKGQYLVEIMDATYTGKVLWEDGTQEDVPCTELNQIDHLDDHAHMPGYFVNKVGNKEELAVVSKYSSKDRTCTVHWLDTDKREEEVSVYSLEYNQKYDFNPMDIIVCLVECSHSSIGQIICVTDTGKLLVHWTDGAISAITPDKCVHLASSDTDYEDISDEDHAEADDDDSSWMTADSDFFSDHSEDKEDEEKNDKPEEFEDASSVDPAVTKPESGDTEKEDISQTTSKVETLQEGGSNSSTGGNGQQNQKSGENEKKNESLEKEGIFVTHTSSDSPDEASTQARKRFRNSKTSHSDPEPAEMCEPMELTAAMQEHANIISESFKMISQCPESHNFYFKKQPGSYQRSFLSAVRKDIKLISNNLPKGIWVRAFEDRMDLLSCLIEGPADTPYEGALFAFDVQLPSNYSTAPPILHYCGYSKTKLNPNLYPVGKVCLSLLGTWTGKGTEQWTESSNLLQLLISIQSLVLNSTPYYNEAGFNKYKETQSGENNAKLYNEMVVYKILDHVVRMFGYPHAAFEKEIRSYYVVNFPKTLQRYDKFIKCSENNTPEDGGITYPLLPLSKGVIPCINTLLNPLKIITAADQIFKPEPISSDEIMESDVLDLVQGQVRNGDEESTEQNIVKEGENSEKTATDCDETVKDGDETVKDGEQSKLGSVSESSVSASRVSTKYDPGPPPMDMIGGESRDRDSSASSTRSQQQS